MTTQHEPPEPPQRGHALLEAVEVMAALRAEGGDAWTRQQTHASLGRYLLEEAHEVLEVIDDPASHGPTALADELGDLLFQILFHARLGEEEDPAWDVDAVARSYVDKMHRRNPHIFGERADEVLEDPQDVEAIIAQWHAAKDAENGGRARGLDEGIPAALPSLQRAAKMIHRARSRGTLQELMRASREAPADEEQQRSDEVARSLLEIVERAEAQDIDPESALRSLLARTVGPSN